MAEISEYFQEQQSNLAAINGYVEEMYSGHNVITSYNGAERRAWPSMPSIKICILVYGSHNLFQELCFL